MSLFKKKDDFCCSTFQCLYEEAGRGTGFGLLIGANSEGEPFALIQHRSVDKNAEQIQLPVGTG